MLCVPLVLALMTSAAFCLPAKASGDDSSVDAVDKQILNRELELYEMGATIKLHMYNRSLWPARRWAAYSINNNVLTAVGAGINSNERLINERRPKKINRNTIISASWCRVMANIVSTLGAGLEWGLDDWSHFQAWRHGFRINDMNRRALDIGKELDELFAKRNTMQCDKMHTLRGELLEDTRNIAFSEYARFLGEYRGGRLRAKISYFLTGASNAVSGAGSYCGIVATRRNSKSKLGGTGGFCDVISGSINMTIPLAVRAGDWADRTWVRRAYCKKFNCDQKYPLEPFQSQIALLRAESPTHDEDAMILQKLDKIYEQTVAGRNSSNVTARTHLIENISAAFVGGGAKVTNGIGTLGAVYGDLPNANDRAKVTGAASLVYMLGNIASGAEYARVHASNELRWHKQGKTHTRPYQVWERNISDIQNMRRELNGNSN